jgi:hypothetical protein
VYIYCTATDASPSTGIRLVWDYLHDGVWSTDTLGDSLAVRTAWNAQTSGQGIAHHWATDAGAAWRENIGIGAGAYLDNGKWVTGQVVGAWTKPTLSGFARFWRVQVSSDVLEPAQINMSLAFDFSGTYTESNSWYGYNIVNFDRYPVCDVQMVPGNQKAKAIQVTLSDAPTIVPGLFHGTSPPAVSVTGSPAAFYTSLTITITTGGLLNNGVVKFSWSLNGVSQQTGQLAAATFTLGSTGLTANFPAGSYTNDNVWGFNSGTTGQGFSWSGYSVELGVSDRAYPNLPAAQK